MKIFKSTTLCLALLATTAPAHGQAITPMRGVVKSATDQFAIRVNPANPYPGRIRVEVNVYDEHFQPIAARVSPSSVLLAASASRSVLVVVPFEGKSERKIRICAESIPFTDNAQRIRTQVCGRFLAQRYR